MADSKTKLTVLEVLSTNTLFGDDAALFFFDFALLITVLFHTSLL